MRRAAALLLLAVSVSACSLFGGKDNSNPPAKLEPLNTDIRMERVWHVDMGKGTDGRYLQLEPAIDGGRIFVAEYRGHVAAFNAESGEKIWKTDIKGRIIGGVGVGGDLVLVGTSEAEVVALGWGDGEIRWRAQIESQVLSQPAADPDTVVVHSLGGDLYGLEAETGKRRWIFDRDTPVLSLRGSSSPVLIQGVVIAGLANGNLVALDAANGRQLWEASVAIPRGRSELERMVDIDSKPQIRSGVIYAVAYHGRVAAIDGSSGGVIWSRDMSSSAGLSVDFQQLYLSDQESHVWALDRQTGGSLWRQEKLSNRGLTAPVPFEDFVAVGDFEGYVHLLRDSDGELMARTRVDRERILARPVVEGGLLYVYGNGGVLAAYRVTSQ